jgi:hypothetical protein
MRAMEAGKIRGEPHNIEDLIRIGDNVYLRHIAFLESTIAIIKDILDRVTVLMLQYSSWLAPAERPGLCCSRSQ